MKILLVNKFFHLNGGSERVFFQEREFLAGSGIEVIDFSMQDERNFASSYAHHFVGKINYDSVKGIKGKLKTALSFIHSREAVQKIEEMIIQEKPDIAHLHNIYHQLTPSIIPVLKRRGVKVVLTLHDYKLICPSYIALDKNTLCTACNGTSFWNTLTRHCQQSWGQELLLMLEGYWHRWRKSYNAVDLFISPSNFLAEMTARRIPSEKISVLPNGIDLDRFIPHYDDKEYGLYFGGLSKEKGIETLLKAHKLLPLKYALNVVGTGPLAERLSAEFREVDFLGYKSGDELITLIKEAAFVVVPSEWFENCSMVVLEAMAYGKPVIGSRIGGIPEQIEDGISGFLVEMGNAGELAERMALLGNDKELRLQMGRAGREKLEREYSLAVHCKELLDIYSEVLA
nr:glycosyltransferase family 4 protein [Desulfobulbaceae bacterium]